MCCKRYHIIFSTFPLNFKCKICVLKDVIPNFKNHIWVTWPAMNLLILKKIVRVWKTKSLLPVFFLRYDPLIVFRGQNHITFIFIKTMSHDLLVQMAYCPLMSRIELCYKIYKINDFSLTKSGAADFTTCFSLCYVNNNTWSSKRCCRFYNFNAIFRDFVTTVLPFSWK